MRPHGIGVIDIARGIPVSHPLSKPPAPDHECQLSINTKPLRSALRKAARRYQSCPRSIYLRSCNETAVRERAVQDIHCAGPRDAVHTLQRPADGEIGGELWETHDLAQEIHIDDLVSAEVPGGQASPTGLPFWSQNFNTNCSPVGRTLPSPQRNQGIPDTLPGTKADRLRR